MREFHGGSYDVAVIGAGHAGIEAALAAARMGMKTVCLTVSLDAVGNMPCNPAIGGTGKGHLVRELDALGGEMAKAADRACIQYRMLNRGKGPAVWSLRAQADRREYQQVMKQTLELQPGLTLRQAEVTEVRCEERPRRGRGAPYRRGAGRGGGHSVHGHVPDRTDHRGRMHRGLRAGRPAPRRRPDGQLAGAGGAFAAVQDRYAAEHTPAQRGLLSKMELQEGDPRCPSALRQRTCRKTGRCAT